MFDVMVGGMISTKTFHSVVAKIFKRLYIKCTAEPYSFLIIGTTLPSNNTWQFFKNLLQ